MNYIDFFSSIQELYQRMLFPVSEKYGLTSMELTILLFLANNPEYDTASEIVRKRHLSKSHVSVSVRSLEEKGYLRREQRDGNHRSEHLVICESGRPAVEKGQRTQQDFLEVLFEGITDERKKEMILGLESMNMNVMDHLGGNSK